MIISGLSTQGTYNTLKAMSKVMFTKVAKAKPQSCQDFDSKRIMIIKNTVSTTSY